MAQIANYPRGYVHMAAPTRSMLTNSNARKAKVRAKGQCALCTAKGTHSVVRAKLVPANQKAAQGYTLYCRKHATRKVAIRAKRAAANAAGTPARAKAKATPKRAKGKAKASPANSGGTPASRRKARQAAAAKAAAK